MTVATQGTARQTLPTPQRWRRGMSGGDRQCVVVIRHQRHLGSLEAAREEEAQAWRRETEKGMPIREREGKQFVDAL